MRANRESGSRERETSQPRLIWEVLIAAKPRIMIRDAVLAGLLPEQLLETRLSEAIKTHLHQSQRS